MLVKQVSHALKWVIFYSCKNEVALHEQLFGLYSCLYSNEAAFE